MNVDLTLAGAVIITGLVVVFIALIGLSAIVWLFGKMFVAMSNKPTKPANLETQVSSAPKSPAPVASVKQAMVVEDGIGDEIIAVISAAIAALDGGAGRFALRSVRRAKEARSAWASAGLTQNTQPF
ncbi:OadG family protein [Oscillospiraceae bacterium PP1C4]